MNLLSSVLNLISASTRAALLISALFWLEDAARASYPQIANSRMSFGRLHFFLLFLACAATRSQISKVKHPTLTYPDLLAISVNRGDLAAVRIAHETWPTLRKNFFATLDPKGAKAVLKYDIYHETVDWLGQISAWGLGLVSSLSADRFNVMKPETCTVFAENLQVISNPLALPESCQKHLLDYGVITIPGISRMPVDWIRGAGAKFISQLYAEHLASLSSKAFSLLVNLGKCQNLQPLALEKLKIGHWYKITPPCLANVRNLELVQIPKAIIRVLSASIFSLYNGPLHKETLRGMTPAQAKGYASLIPENVVICEELYITDLTLEAALEISPRCLWGFLQGKLSKQVLLGPHWTALERPFLQLTKELTDRFFVVPTENYRFMTPAVIEKLLTSKTNLEHLKRTRAHTALFAELANLNSKHFKMLVEYSGDVAGAVLFSAKSLPDDTFAYFEAEDYFKLGGYTGRQSFWGDDLLPALAHHKNFDRLVTNFSLYSTSHYCERLNLDEYSKRLWLREYAGPSCWNALPFEITNDLRSQLPELDRVNMSWSEFMGKDPQRWASLPPHPLSDLLQIESFCEVLKDMAPLGFLHQQPHQVLKIIGAKCAAHLYKFLTGEIVDKMANDAFQLFTTEMIPPGFKLAKLRASQIPHVSAGLPEYCHSTHIFTTITAKDLSEIDRVSLWKFTDAQLKVMFRDKPTLPALAIAALESSMSIGHQGLFDRALHTCNSLLGSGNSEGLKCADLIRWYQKSSGQRQKYYALLDGSEISKLAYLKAALAQNPEEFRLAILRDHSPPSPSKLLVALDPYQGFNRQESTAILINRTDEFSNAKMQISVFGMVETEWLQKPWIDQMMLEICERITVQANPTNPKVRNFTWRIGREAAYLAGLVFGKALQQGIPLAFTFDNSFWRLLMSRTSVDIDNYYYETFNEERERFLVGFQFEALSISQPVYIRPFCRDALTFATLESPAKLEIPAIHREMADGLEEISVIENFEARFFSPLDNAIREEFHAVVHSFFAGLDKLIDIKLASLVQNFSVLKRLVDSPLPTTDGLLEAIAFQDGLESIIIKSLVPGHNISAADAIRSFLLALAPRQLEKLVKVWTGISLLPTAAKLNVCRVGPTMQHPVVGMVMTDLLVNTVNSPASQTVISSKDEYWSLFDTILGIQRAMILYPSAESTHHHSGIIRKLEFLPTKVSASRNLLCIHPQPAKALIDSLVLLINTPSALFLTQTS